MDKTERVNVNKIKDFGEAAKQEKVDREAFETARCLNLDSMKETIPWSYPKVIEITTSLVHWGSSSREKFTQVEREELILQEIFLSKDSIPDSPREPDPESYEQIPPKLIPLDEVSSVEVAAFQDAIYQGSASVSTDGASGLRLQPATASMMDSVGAATGQSMSSSVKTSNPLNVQEIRNLIMQGAQGNPKPEELLKQPDISDYIKQLLGSLRSQPAILPGGSLFETGFCVRKQPDFSNYIKQLLGSIQSPPQIIPEAGVGLRGPTLLPNGFPSVPKNTPHFPPGELMPPSRGPLLIDPGVLDGHVGPMGPGCPVGGPSNSGKGSHERGHRGHDQNRDWSSDQGYDIGHDDSYDGGHNRGYDGEHNRGYDGGHERGHGRGHVKSHEDMSRQSLCRHFMIKGNCRYEHNCAFYHPGVNGPPLLGDSNVSKRSKRRHFMMKGNRQSKHKRAFDHPGVNGPPLPTDAGLNGPPLPRDTDMSTRSVCRHFMKKGNCRYEHNCVFYHPGVNGPPLPMDTGE